MNGIARIFTAHVPTHERGERFAGLPRRLQIYVALTATAGAVLAAWCAASARVDRPLMFLGLIAASVVLGASKVPLPLLHSGATMSLSYCTNFAALALLGPDQATLIVAASGWSQCVLNSGGRTAPHRIVFSVASLIVAIQAASVAATFAGGFGTFVRWQDLAAPTIAGATAFFFCNTSMVALAVGLASGQSTTRIWQEQFMWSAPVCYIGAAVGSALAYLLQTSQGWIAPLAATPLYLTYRSYKSYLGRVEDQQRHLDEVSALHLASVEALARAIGARDQTLEASRAVSDTHVRRVQKLAVSLARAADMPENEIKGLEVAALLHDIGKLAVPEHILNKPGRLTPAEFQAIRAHPTVGAEIIKAVPFPYPVASLIEAHHERWNGTGYPLGLAGEAIPLGARILGIVDYFDALIADRPYHRALSEPEAMEIIIGEAGKALDPTLVEKFVQILRETPAENRDDTVPHSADHSRVDAFGDPATGLMRDADGTSDEPSAFENIALANHEMRALYEVAEAMGTRLSVADTMALLASKLTVLVSASSWALFLYDEATAVSRCAFATGLDSDLLRQVAVPTGSGTIGWMAVRMGPIVNARPGADFEASAIEGTTSLSSMLAVPLAVHGRLLGTLAAYHVDHDHFTAAHHRVLDRVSAQASQVVHDALVFEQMRSDSLTDPLTGLPNSRALIAHLEREMSRADRHQTTRALLVIDVDRFKTINDGFGHQAGDRALRHVADILQRFVRAYDFCARNGGDEFVVILAECDGAQAARRTVELKDAVAAIPFEAAPDAAIRIGISVGYAVYPSEGQSFEVLLRQADHRMYQDKAARKRAAVA
jgi:diguanylate cyclase (GGDEF)-like protein/putative nucleotidyltransferase with HDIG domain